MKSPEREHEQAVLHYWRAALAALESDHLAVSMNRRWGHEYFAARLMLWSEEFATLYQDILKLWRSYFPQHKGRYVTKHIASGYSSIAVQRWVDDKVQPARPTPAQLVQQFDNLVAAYQNIASLQNGSVHNDPRRRA